MDSSHYGPGSISENSLEHLNVPRGLVGLVIGRGGETIRDLQGKSGCHIQVARDDDPSAPDRVVVISGNPEQVKFAKELISNILCSRNNGGGSGYHGGEAPPDALKLAVPNEKVGLIIGRGGMTVKGIQTRSGANVMVPSAPDADNPQIRTLVLTGTPDQKEAARIEIQMVMSDQCLGMPTGPHTIYMQLPNEKVLPSLHFRR